MKNAPAGLKVSIGVDSFLKAPMDGSHTVATATPQAVLVPIRTIGPAERLRLAAHLLALEPPDRYLRFGFCASDKQVHRYVDGLDFDRDELFGIYNGRLELIAIAHLAFAPVGQHTGCAEFGVSVSQHARNRGYGARLFERAMVAARNEGLGMLFIHALSENAAMLKIARNAGATVVRNGAESQAHLQLPAATLESRISEIALDRFAEVDYQLKARAKRFWGFFATMQEIGCDVRDTRDRTSQ